MSSQLTLEDSFDVPDRNPRVVDRPEAIEWMDYHEHLRIQREREAQR